ncbi:helix-turn-helix domain-containing protein [Solibacillus silvestris]|uniref:helix-turn-helix domain-containing protein n=1 Tax=Solibacillus silvestris TaxID=76853 RepID=UPI003F806FD3
MEKKRDLSNLGGILKMNRIQQGITQEEMSLGICTPSYLSRIENSNVTADLEIYELLFQKLNIDLSAKQQESENINEKLEALYTELLMNKKPDEATLEVLEAFENPFLESEFHLKRGLVLGRYLIYLGKYEEAKIKINAIGKTIKATNSRNYFLFINIAILLSYLTNEYQHSYGVVQTTIDNSDFFKYDSDFEVACYYFNAALVASKLYKYQNSIDYCTLALDYFENLYKPSLDFKCHLLLGIARNNLYHFTAAEEHYLICNNILENIQEAKNSNNFNMLYTNLGYCKECQEDFEQAIVYYLKAIDYEADAEVYINLVRCNFKVGKFNEAVKYLKVIQKFETLTIKIQHQVNIFSILLAEDSSSRLTELTKIDKDAMKYFENKKLYVWGEFYAKILANFYKEMYMYKKSSHYFEKALKFQK